MSRAAIDPCVLVKSTNGSVDEVVGVQVDDTICPGTSDFLAYEERTSTEFPSKGRTLVVEDSVGLNGVFLHRKSGAIHMHQRKYLSELPKITRSTRLTFKEFTSIRAKYAYASFSSVPDELVFSAMLAQFTERRYNRKEEDAMKLLRKLSKLIHSGIA